MKTNKWIRKLLKAGCYLVRQGKGSHEIWYSPVTGKEFVVPKDGSQKIGKGLESKINSGYLSLNGIKNLIMKNYKFIVEKTSTGFSAFAEDENTPVFSTGKDLEELKNNILDALNLYLDHSDKRKVASDNIITKNDLPSFFEFYSVINAKALSKRINMNETLLSQYVSGKKTPSEKQIQRILTGVKDLGKELMQLEIA